MTAPATCPCCGRAFVDAAGLARQADRLRAVVQGVQDLLQAHPSGYLALSYGGRPLEALRGLLDRGEAIAVEHARTAACVAETCRPSAPSGSLNTDGEGEGAA